jgi:hypothetical protein
VAETTCRGQTTRQNRNVKLRNKTSWNGGKSKFYSRKLNSRLKSRNACCHSVQNLLSSSMPHKNTRIKIYRTVILPVVVNGCEIWFVKHLLRINNIHSPKLVYEYFPTGTWNMGQPRKRWRFQHPWRRNNPGMVYNLLLLLLLIMIMMIRGCCIRVSATGFQPNCSWINIIIKYHVSDTVVLQRRRRRQWLIIWGSILLKKLTAAKLVHKIPAFYVSRSFITVSTTAGHLALSWCR